MSAEIADILDRCADKLEPEGAWIQGRFAGGGCWCALGAVYNFGAGEWDVIEGLRRVVGYAVISWNDHPSRTQAQVVAAFRQAAANERGKP